MPLPHGQPRPPSLNVKFKFTFLCLLKCMAELPHSYLSCTTGLFLQVTLSWHWPFGDLFLASLHFTEYSQPNQNIKPEDVWTKDERSMFFFFSLPRSDYRHPDPCRPPCQIFIFHLGGKYLDKIFPDSDDPEVSISSFDIQCTRHWWDQTRPVSGPFYINVCC